MKADLSPATEEFAVVRGVLPFQRRMIPKRLAAGGFMLIYVDRFNREKRDQHRTIPELVAARDKLPRRNRIGSGRWNTKFAVTLPDDVFLDDQDRLCAWAPDTPAKLEQAAAQRRQSERSDLGRHKGLTKSAKDSRIMRSKVFADAATNRTEHKAGISMRALGVRGLLMFAVLLPICVRFL